jgi:hypothetical protein
LYGYYIVTPAVFILFYGYVIFFENDDSVFLLFTENEHVITCNYHSILKFRK